jgi:hypothetical protein
MALVLTMVMCTSDVTNGIMLESFNKEDKVCLCCFGGCADRPRATWGYTYIEQCYCNVIRVASVEGSFPSV